MNDDKFVFLITYSLSCICDFGNKRFKNSSTWHDIFFLKYSKLYFILILLGFICGYICVNVYVLN